MHKYQLDKFKKIALPVAVMVVAGVAFWGGMAYQKSKTPATAAARNPASFSQSGRFGGTQGQRPVFGTVSDISGNTLTVTTRQGTTTKVIVTDSTSLTKADRSTAKIGDFTSGASVIAFGKVGDDGSIQATRLSLAPSSPSDIPQ